MLRAFWCLVVAATVLSCDDHAASEPQKPTAPVPEPQPVEDEAREHLVTKRAAKEELEQKQRLEAERRRELAHYREAERRDHVERVAACDARPGCREESWECADSVSGDCLGIEARLACSVGKPWTQKELRRLLERRSSVPQTWRTFGNGLFTFRAPRGMKQTDVHGRDSFVREYVGSGLRIRFEHGRYGSGLVCAESGNVVIDGKRALLRLGPTPYAATETLIAAFEKSIADGGPGEGLSFGVILEENGRTERAASLQQAVTIVRSIKFK